MYLKRIELQGFKSFANKTEIEFGKDITAIVGPNGSGKSNISDAIRWVLGEQSVKNLRGSKMEDIIFSGTNTRRALGFAEVSMYFDNKDRHIPIDYNEVAITRRMFRSGESEYYINKNTCRLKDIRQLFMDTGIGKDGYSIIGQGRIDEILSDRPEDRRSIFEEAAGIVRYKSKKEDTEKKLLRTEENLIRIKDLLNEISRQEKSLALEANKAKTFTALYDELKVLEVNLYIKDVNSIQKEIHDIKMEMKEDIELIEDKEKSREKTKEEIQDLQEKINSVQDIIQKTKKKKRKLIEKIQNNKNQIDLLDEREKHGKRDISRIKEDIESLLKSKRDINKEIENLNSEKRYLKEEYNIIKNDFEMENEKLLDINRDIENKENNIEIEKDKLIEIYNSISNKKSEFKSIESTIKNIQEKIIKLNKDLEVLKYDRNTNKNYLENLLPKEIKLQKDIHELIDERSKFNSEKEKYKKGLEKNSEELKSKEIRLQGIVSNYNLYQNMEEYYEGYYSSVKNLLNSIRNSKINTKGYIGVVVDLLKVDKIYEKAIEVSLGSRLQNIVTEKEEDAKYMIEFLKKNNKGRVTFLPLDVIKGNPINLNIKLLKKEGVLGLGHELVNYNNEYKDLFQYLLGRTIIIDNIDNGIKLANKLNHRYRIVTLNGDILNPGGSLTGGSYNNKFNLISRKNKIKELRKKIENEREIIKQLEAESELILEKYRYNNKMEISVDEEFKDKELNLIKLNNKKENLLEKENRLEKEIENSLREIKLSKKETKKQKEKKSLCADKIEDLNNISLELKKNIESLNKELSEYKKNQYEINEKATSLRIKLNDCQNKLDNVNNSINNNNKENKNNINSLENKRHILKSTDENIELISKDKKEIIQKIKTWEKDKEIIYKKIKKIIKEKEDLINYFKIKENKAQEINKVLIMTEKNKNNKDLNLSKSKLKLENKNRRLLEDYELNYESALEMKDSSIDIDSKIPKISELKKSIKQLGNINLAALEDYKLVKERLNFLEKQYTDLIESKEDLNKLIKDIEKEMRTKFNKSFQEINRNFKKIFAVFFNGGKGSLELDDKTDVLNSGIQIRVQPPGKKLQNISLLSGGEKSLTAVALLFSILELKPAPFCILDEIDASLDEANINRYTDYLKRINDKTQFILITHQKTTMEIANILYGVTMAEKGISRLLSVKLEDYIDELVS